MLLVLRQSLICQERDNNQLTNFFVRLSKECHPDKVGEDNIEALLQFQAISEAYATLSDPKLRRKYDRGVLGRAR